MSGPLPAGAAGGDARARASLTTGIDRTARPRSGQARLERLLYRALSRDPDAVLALRPTSGPDERLRWGIAPAPAMSPRLLEIWRPGRPYVAVELSASRTIADVRDELWERGVDLAYSTPDVDVLALSSLALIPGDGLEDTSNGDHIYARRSVLSAWTDDVGRWVDRVRLDVREMLRMTTVPGSEGEWSELWGSYFNVYRKKGETDAGLNFRTAYEWRRPRNNPNAMELNVLRLLSQRVTVREPWKEMFIASATPASSGYHLPNDAEFYYHRIQLRSADVWDWGPAMAEAEADRPAGTLLMAPVTLPDPFLVDASGHALDFAGEAEFVTRIRDEDGQILSVNCSASNTYVLMSPLFSREEDMVIEGARTGDPGTMANYRTICLGEIVASEQHALGDLQNRLPGRMMVERGAQLRASGARDGTWVEADQTGALSDYTHAARYEPVDEWFEEELAFAIDAGGAGPEEQGPFWPEEERSFEVDGSAAADGDPERVRFFAEQDQVPWMPDAYDAGWTGRWDRRPWQSGWPAPAVDFAASEDAFGGSAAGAAAASGTLLVAVRFAALAGAGATAAAELTTGILMEGQALAEASVAFASVHAPILLAGVPGGAATAGGELTVTRPVAAAASAGATATAELTTAILLQAQAFAAAVAPTAELVNNLIAAAAQGAAAAQASLTALRAVAAAAAGQAAASASLHTVPAWAALPATGAAAAATGSLLTSIRLTTAGAGVGGSALASGALQVGVRFASSASTAGGRSAASAALMIGVRLAASAPGRATASATLTVPANYSLLASETGTLRNDVGIVGGTRFTTSQAGSVTALKVYKAVANQQLGTLRLWNRDTQALLASVAIPSGAAVGWVTVALGTPVALAAGGNYIVSYNCDAGYTHIESFWGSRTSGPLSANSSAWRDLGGSGHDFPNLTDNWCYLADVVFRTT